MRNPFSKHKRQHDDLDFLIDVLLNEVSILIGMIDEIKQDLADLTDFVEGELD